MRTAQLHKRATSLLPRRSVVVMLVMLVLFGHDAVMAVHTTAGPFAASGIAIVPLLDPDARDLTIEGGISTVQEPHLVLPHKECGVCPNAVTLKGGSTPVVIPPVGVESKELVFIRCRRFCGGRTDHPIGRPPCDAAGLPDLGRRATEGRSFPGSPATCAGHPRRCRNGRSLPEEVMRGDFLDVLPQQCTSPVPAQAPGLCGRRYRDDGWSGLEATRVKANTPKPRQAPEVLQASDVRLYSPRFNVRPDSCPFVFVHSLPPKSRRAIVTGL
jgi:hypothetical protein